MVAARRQTCPRRCSHARFLACTRPQKQSRLEFLRDQNTACLPLSDKSLFIGCIAAGYRGSWLNSEERSYYQALTVAAFKGARSIRSVPSFIAASEAYLWALLAKGGARSPNPAFIWKVYPIRVLDSLSGGVSACFQAPKDPVAAFAEVATEEERQRHRTRNLPNETYRKKFQSPRRSTSRAAAMSVMTGVGTQPPKLKRAMDWIHARRRATLIT